MTFGVSQDSIAALLNVSPALVARIAVEPAAPQRHRAHPLRLYGSPVQRGRIESIENGGQEACIRLKADSSDTEKCRK